MFTDLFSTVHHFFFEEGVTCDLVNTGATTQGLLTPRSSPVYPMQEVVLEEPIPEWGTTIPDELGSRNDILACFDNQIYILYAWPDLSSHYNTIGIF